MAEGSEVLVANARGSNPLLEEALKRAGLDVMYGLPQSVQEYIEMLRGKKIVVDPPRTTAEVLDSVDKLRLIQVFGIGYDHIDMATAWRRGIYVCNVPEIMAESVAQHAWALILDLSKKVARCHVLMRSGGWMNPVLGTQLWGKTLGVVGFGAIGRRITRIGRALNMKILAYDPHVSKQVGQLLYTEMVDLENLIQRSDVITVCVPLTEETRGLIGAKQLTLMKPTSFIVNISRGEVVDEEALIKCLQNGTIAGAGLDVFAVEPLPSNNLLRSLDNVVITPHIASHTIEAFTEVSAAVAENVQRVLRNERPNWIVNAT